MSVVPPLPPPSSLFPSSSPSLPTLLSHTIYEGGPCSPCSGRGVHWCLVL